MLVSSLGHLLLQHLPDVGIGTVDNDELALVTIRRRLDIDAPEMWGDRVCREAGLDRKSVV